MTKKTNNGHTLKYAGRYSDGFGPCSVCGEGVVDPVYDLNVYKRIQIKGHSRWAFEAGGFGHRECLLNSLDKSSVALVTPSEWAKIDDGDCVWSSEECPEWIGRKIAITGGIIPGKTGTLAIEGIHFEISGT